MRHERSSRMTAMGSARLTSHESGPMFPRSPTASSRASDPKAQTDHLLSPGRRDGRCVSDRTPRDRAWPPVLLSGPRLSSGPPRSQSAEQTASGRQYRGRRGRRFLAGSGRWAASCLRRGDVRAACDKALMGCPPCSGRQVVWGSSAARDERKTYSVVGMTCDHCVRSVMAEVGKLPGVTAVEVDLATGPRPAPSPRTET